MSRPSAWHALESDPDLWGIYMDKLGVDIDHLEFTEIYSLDEDFPPEGSVFAYIFLYPDDGSSAKSIQSNPSDNKLWTIKQVEELDSCCCLIALLHAIGNNFDKVRFRTDSILWKFFERSQSMNSEQRAAQLVHDEDIHRVHEQIARQGQTEMLESERVGYHYVAFVLSDENHLYEMNGSSRGPQAKFIEQSSKDKLFQSVAREVKRRIDRTNGNIRFNLIGMTNK